MSAEAYILAGIGGFILGRSSKGQIIEIPIQVGGAEVSAFTVFDELAASGTESYTRTVNKAGRITGVWMQFYHTHCLLSHKITVLHGSVEENVIQFFEGQESEGKIALDSWAGVIPCNRPFAAGDTLKIVSTNEDADDLHRVRVVVVVQYG